MSQGQSVEHKVVGLTNEEAAKLQSDDEDFYGLGDFHRLSPAQTHKVIQRAKGRSLNFLAFYFSLCWKSTLQVFVLVHPKANLHVTNLRP